MPKLQICLGVLSSLLLALSLQSPAPARQEEYLQEDWEEEDLPWTLETWETEDTSESGLSGEEESYEPLFWEEPLYLEEEAPQDEIVFEEAPLLEEDYSQAELLTEEESLLLLAEEEPGTAEGKEETPSSEDLSWRFPDPDFLAALQELFGTETISAADCEAVKVLELDFLGIRDLTGLECFPALEELSCLGNEIASLDLSANPALTTLICPSNPLTSLNLTSNPRLEILECYDTGLTALDLSGNPSLRTLILDDNRLTALDLSGNPLLRELSCISNQLRRLDLSHNRELESLSCSFNQLSSLDLSAKRALRDLDCSFNKLTSLKLKDCPELLSLYCNDNALSSLSLKNNPLLEELGCDHNQLTKLDLSANRYLFYLDASYNRLGELKAGHLKSLGYLYVSHNLIRVSSRVEKPQTCSIYQFSPQDVPLYYLRLSPAKATLYLNSSVKSVTLVPSTNGKVAYATSDSSIAKVNKSGVVTVGSKTGTATITVSINGAPELTASCKVTVKKPNLTLKAATLKVKKNKKVTIAYANAPAGTPVFTSSNPKIAKVSKNGVVTGKKKGTTTIKVTWCGITKKVKIKVS